MFRAAKRPHPVFVGALIVALAYGASTMWRRALRPPGRWVGRTDCEWFGPPRITMWPGSNHVDSVSAYAHERVHASQCSQLGPARYRWHTLFAESKLGLEIPAYCAGAAERRRITGDSTFFSRATMLQDVLGDMGDVTDSATIARAIARECPAFAAR